MHRHFFAVVLCVMGARHASAADISRIADPLRSLRQYTESEAVPELLVPPRTEDEVDSIQAQTYFTYGRFLFQRQDFPGALRAYQRAWRYDPGLQTVLRDIILLANSIDRNDEASRYALIAVDGKWRHPVLMTRLAFHLTGQQDWDGALKLYRAALELRANRKPDVSTIMLYMELGRLNFLVSKYDESAQAFRHVREALDHPEKYGLTDTLHSRVLGKPEQTYRLMAESFYQAKQYDEAEDLFKRAAAADKNKSLLALHLARVDSRRKDYQAALDHLDEYFAMKATVGGEDAYDLLDELVHHLEGDKDKAQERVRARLQQLHEDDPDNRELALYLAANLAAAGKDDRSEAIYNDLLADDESGEALDGLLAIQLKRKDRRNAWVTLGKRVRAASNLDAAGPVVEGIVADKALVKLMLDELDAKIDDNPPFLADGVALAAAYLALDGDNLERAKKFFQLALENGGPERPTRMTQWGLELFISDHYEEACRVFRQIIDEDVQPENRSTLLFYLAGALEMDGKTDEAIEVAKDAVKLAEQSPRVRSRQAWILYHAGRYEAAENSYRELLDEFDDNHASPVLREIMRDARLVLSNLSVHLEHLPDAEEWLEQVLDEYPNHIGAQNDLGYLWIDQNKNLQRALAMVRRAVAAEPENEAYLDSLGWAYYRLGEFEKSVVELEKATAGEDPDGVILDHLGDAYLGAKQKAKALATWRRAAESFRLNEESKFLKATEAKIETHSKG